MAANVAISAMCDPRGSCLPAGNGTVAAEKSVSKHLCVLYSFIRLFSKSPSLTMLAWL